MVSVLPGIYKNGHDRRVVVVVDVRFVLPPVPPPPPKIRVSTIDAANCMAQDNCCISNATLCIVSGIPTFGPPAKEQPLHQLATGGKVGTIRPNVCWVNVGPASANTACTTGEIGSGYNDMAAKSQ